MNGSTNSIAPCPSFVTCSGPVHSQKSRIPAYALVLRIRHRIIWYVIECQLLCAFCIRWSHALLLLAVIVTLTSQGDQVS